MPTDSEYLDQGEYYWSDSRGKMPVTDMHASHAQNAADKLVRSHPEARGRRLHLALLLQAGDAEVDPTYDRDGEEAF